jgi:RNA polymerase sigma-70 factor, ECF subfamily
MIKHPEDNEIIELFNQGGTHANTAFNLLVTKYGELLYRQIRSITRNHENTNDILQNVLVKVYQNLPKFKGDSALPTWMYRIARNETLNFLDKEKRRASVHLDEPILEIMAGHHMLDNTNAEVISDLLNRAIQTLPEKQALVFQMKYFEDLKYTEISAKLNTSVGALKASFHHAKQKIEEFVVLQLNL